MVSYRYGGLNIYSQKMENNLIKRYSSYIKENNNHSKDDPYNEEDWDDLDVFNVGDIVICINNDNNGGNPWASETLKLNNEYEVEKLVSNLLKLKGENKYLWGKDRFIRKINENIDHSDEDPYDEEDWTDIGIDRDFKYGDTVICLQSVWKDGNIAKKQLLHKDLDYEVTEVGYHGNRICVRGVPNWWRKDLFRKQTPEDEYFCKEHIAYLEDDEPDEIKQDPFEIIDVVSLPSGQFLQIYRDQYDKQRNIINWSERLKCYVCRDKDLDAVKKAKDDNIFAIHDWSLLQNRR